MTDPEEIKKLLLHVINDKIHNAPRSQQKRIGPSEVGHPCERWMVYKLSDTPAPTGVAKDKWLATIGTFVHAGLAEWFEEFNTTVGVEVFGVEQRVEVGSIREGDGHDLDGSCDLYVNGVVVDWKIVGKTTLDSARRKGASRKYRVQAHSYARGWKNAGKPVTHVAVFFLPRNAPLSQAVWWCEEYDEQIAVEGLARVVRIKTLVHEHGREAAALVEGDPTECNYCPWWRPRETNLAKGCPGVITRTSSDIESLLPPD